MMSTLVVANFSIIGDNAGSGLAESPPGTTDGKGNRIGGPMFGPIDPLLRPLADYGGTMPTHALAPGSPAIDAGNPAAVAGIGGVPQYDQRGEPFGRVFDGRIDIGAFEFQMPAPTELVVDILVDESDGNYAPGDLSLREAAQLANLAPDTNTIQFSPALTAGGPATLALMRGACRARRQRFYRRSRCRPSHDRRQRQRSNARLADGEGSGIFILGDDDEDLLDAQISGLTLTGGDAQYGGAILSTENLTLQNCTITGNYAAQLGGGVAVLYGDVVIDNCLITNNGTDETTATGGGIAASSTASLVITRQHDLRQRQRRRRRHPRLRHAPLRRRLHDRKQYRLGLRGLRWWNLPQKRRSSLSPTAPSPATPPSAAAASTATPTPHSLASPCRAITLTSTAARSISFGKLRIHESTITSNSAALDGGGIRARSDVQIDGSALEENEAGRWGGAAWIEVVGGPLTITTSTLSGNSATNEGGALWVSGVDATATIAHSTIADNRTSDVFGFGGGITIRNVTLLVENSMVSGNSAATGGGFYADDSALSIIDSSIESNSADGYTSAGGGIYQTLGTLTIFRSTISENSAKTGGGIYASGQLTLTRTTIRDNVADLDGGGILAAGEANIDSSLLHNNTASRNGGAIAVETGDVTIVNSTLSGNSAGALGGGVWAAEPVDIRHSTLFENQAGVAGGGIFLISGSLPLNHTIVARNVAPAGPDLTGLLGTSFSPRLQLDRFQCGQWSSGSAGSHPDSNGNTIGGNIDPLLGPLADNGGITLTHALLAGSPATDAGDPNFNPADPDSDPMTNDAVPYDQRGTPFGRVFDNNGNSVARIDIGPTNCSPRACWATTISIASSMQLTPSCGETRGSRTDLRADGNGNGIVDQADFDLWATNFGKTVGPFDVSESTQEELALQLREIAALNPDWAGTLAGGA